MTTEYTTKQYVKAYVRNKAGTAIRGNEKAFNAQNEAIANLTWQAVHCFELTFERKADEDMLMSCYIKGREMVRLFNDWFDDEFERKEMYRYNW